MNGDAVRQTHRSDVIARKLCSYRSGARTIKKAPIREPFFFECTPYMFG
jgi:hypothetical protein